MAYPASGGRYYTRKVERREGERDARKQPIANCVPNVDFADRPHADSVKGAERSGRRVRR